MSQSNKYKFLLFVVLLLCPTLAWAWPDRAVVVVGPVDPPENVRTRSYIAEAEQVAKILDETGCEVTRLYHPKASWQRVVRASQNADLFVYYGHGNGYGWMGYTEADETSGLCLSDPGDPELTECGPGIPGGSAEELRELSLAPGSVVVLIHTCYSTGSSKLDDQAVDYGTARQRVDEYARAFFEAGASYYIATSFSAVAPDYFREWLNGKPLREAFDQLLGGQRSYASGNILMIEDRERPNDPYPWVSALVENDAGGVRLAGALAQPSSQEEQAAPEKNDGSRLGHVVPVIMVREPKRNNRESSVLSDSRKNAKLIGERDIRSQSIFFGRLNGVIYDRSDALGELRYRLGPWWSFNGLLPLNRWESTDEWVPTGVFQNWCSISCTERFRAGAEVVSAPIYSADFSDAIYWRPAGVGESYYLNVVSQIAN